VIYVSCSPDSFAKEAAVLCEKGYILEKVIPVDQFMWAAHTEVVGIFKITL
jgi:23S rRNA (uracil1939-C5)-methyltransferase